MRLNVIKTVLERQDGSRLSQYLATISGAIVLFTAGIHLGWPAPSIRKIISPEYPFDITEEEASYIVIVGYIGHVMGGFSASILADKIGRKWTLLSVAFPQLLAFGLIYFSYCSKSLLYCARIAGGVGEGATLAILPTYISEISDPSIRGLLGTFTTLTLISGGLFVNIVGYYYNIHTTALISLSFPILNWILFTNCPESPYYLLMKNKSAEATKCLQILRRRANVEKEILSLTNDVERQMSESGGYKDLFILPSNRKAFLIVSITRFFQQFTGCTAFTSYYQILIERSTSLSPVMGSSVLLLTQIVMTVVSSIFIDKCGRKSLFTYSSALTFTILFILGTLFSLKDYTSLDLSHLDWFPLPLMMMYVVVFSVGLGVCVNIFSSEIYSTSIKFKAMSLGSVIFASTMMSSTKFYQYTADNFGLAVPFYSFSAITFAGTLFFHFKLPETKGKSLEAIQQELKGNFKRKLPL